MPRLIPNIENRVRKLPKPATYSQALQPLFEAVSNAFYAIEDRVVLGMTEPGQVRIDITNLTDATKFRVEISDNGIGVVSHPELSRLWSEPLGLDHGGSPT